MTTSPIPNSSVSPLDVRLLSAFIPEDKLRPSADWYRFWKGLEGGGLGGSGGVVGADTQVIFNDAGAYAGNSALTFNKATGKLSAGTAAIMGGTNAFDASGVTLPGGGKQFKGVGFDVGPAGGLTCASLVDNGNGTVAGVLQVGFTTSPFALAKFDVRGGGHHMIYNDPLMATYNNTFNPGSPFFTNSAVSINVEWTNAFSSAFGIGHAVKIENIVRSGVPQVGSSFALECSTLVDQAWFDTGGILIVVGTAAVNRDYSAGLWSISRGYNGANGTGTSSLSHGYRFSSETNSNIHPGVGYFVTSSGTDNFCRVGFQTVASDEYGFLCGADGVNQAGGGDPTNPFAYVSKIAGQKRFWIDNLGTVKIRGNDNSTSALWTGFNNSLTLTSVIRANGNFESATNSYGSISDRRLKSNIADAPPTLRNFLKLPIRTFNKQDVEGEQIGVIADEAKRLFPREVYEGDDGLDRVNYAQLFGPHLGKAFQEFVTETRDTIVELTREIAALRARST